MYCNTRQCTVFFNIFYHTYHTIPYYTSLSYTILDLNMQKYTGQGRQIHALTFFRVSIVRFTTDHELCRKQQSLMVDQAVSG